MAPRGRPPGRKAALPTRQQHSEKLAKTPKTPKAKSIQALKKAAAAASASAGRASSSPTATEIHVAPSAEEAAETPGQTGKSDKKEKKEKKKQQKEKEPAAAQQKPEEPPQLEEPNETPAPTQTRQSSPVDIPGIVAETPQLPAVPDEDSASDSNSVMVTRTSPAPAPEATAASFDAPGDLAVLRSVSGRHNSGPTPRPYRQQLGGYTSPSIDLEAVYYRQMTEDIDAYKIDLDFCLSQLALNDLTPQEMRTLQLRRLDLSHQIRYCRHRKQVLEAQRQLKGGRPLARTLPPTLRGQGHQSNGLAAGLSSSSLSNGVGGAVNGVKRTANGVPKKRLLATDERNGTLSSSTPFPGRANDPAMPFKRPRAASEMSGQDTISIHSSGSAVAAGGATGGGRAGSDDVEVTAVHNYTHHAPSYAAHVFEVDDRGSEDPTASPSSSLQRLGFWKCRLCLSEKYLMAGPGRQPNAPSKWPLKDMGKLMSHYFDMHTEHEPDERCAELGDALDRNRGPFEYWLRKSRAQKITDRSVIDHMIEELQNGRVPKMLRDLCRAAAAFPGA